MQTIFHRLAFGVGLGVQGFTFDERGFLDTDMLVSAMPIAYVGGHTQVDAER